MTSRVRSSDSVSFSSSGSRLSFGGGSLTTVRLQDLDDEYGFGTEDDVEEATEATESSEDQRQLMPEEHVIPAGGEISESDSLAPDRSSMGSNDSKDHSKIGALIDKAKHKTRKLVTRKDKEKKVTKEETTTEECETLLVRKPESSSPSLSSDMENSPTKEGSPTNSICSPVNTSSPPTLITSMATKCRTMPFFKYRLLMLGVLISITLKYPGFIVGILWGFYVSFIGFLYLFVSDPNKDKGKRPSFIADDRLTCDDVDVALEASSSDDGSALGLQSHVVYRGWMNELKARYSPAAYHVNCSQSVLVRLEGSTLRISRPAKAGLKHAFHEDPTLKQSLPTMVAQSIYDLTDARVSLRPKRLAARRWWSRKYPIHIRFSHKHSALAEVDLARAGMTRSVSLHPVKDEPSIHPVMTAIEDPGYSAESETTEDEEETRLLNLPRSNSTGDLVEFNTKSEGLSRKRKGRSIYLFVRAAREKERWFHLLREACARPVIEKTSQPLQRRASCFDERSISEEPVVKPDVTLGRALEYILYRRNHLHYAKEMYTILGSGVSAPEKDSTVSLDLGTMKWHPGKLEENSDLVESINALGARIFFDFCRDKFWANAVKQKIQSKLATIHLPYFIETLSLSELDLGGTAPRIMGVYAPKMDEWGLWVDFEMHYQGGIRLVLQTSVNLIKLQSGQNTVEAERKMSKWTDSVRATRYSDDDIPESPESSPDEDFGSKNKSDGTTREKTGKKLLTFVERAAQSSLFQKAAKLPRVAKFMEEMSTTPLILNVEIEMLEGTMTVNIPPPPSDRLWYAFRKVPKVSIRAVPQVGDRSVDMTTVSDWIESKLRLLIEKNLVCPNMDDIILPVMSGNSLLHYGYNK